MEHPAGPDRISLVQDEELCFVREMGCMEA
jgi:hypothetical protein